jgi:hypothetical protein
MTDVITKRSRAYILEYRHKNRFSGTANGRTLKKVFWFDGQQKEAIIEARRHCEVMDYIFIYCEPFIVDLRAQESLKARNMNTASFQTELEDYIIEENQQEVIKESKGTKI